MDLLSRLDCYNIGRLYILSRATKIEPTVVDVAGSDANLFVGSTSFMAYGVALQLADRLGDLYLDSASGEGLDRFASDRYQLFRKAASPAIGTVQFIRPTTGGGSGTIDIGTKLQTLTGVEYYTTQTAFFSGSDLTTFANVSAVQAGNAFQVGRNQIRRFSSTPFDSTIIVNNIDPTSGGEDIETDPVFKERIRDFWNSARRGVLGAIEFGAKSVDGVVSASASEAMDSLNRPARVVSLFIADSSGISNSALADQVTIALGEFRAAGVKVIIDTSIPQLVNIQLKLTFRAGVDTVTLTEAIRAAVLEFVNDLPVNGPMYHSGLSEVLTRFSNNGLIVTDGTIAAPIGDTVPDLGFTLRATLSNIQVV